MKVGSADPDCSADADDKANERAHHTQGCSLGGEEALQHTTGGPQGFHEGKVRRRSETHPVNVESTQTAAVRMIRIAETRSVARIFPKTWASPSVTCRTAWTSATGRAWERRWMTPLISSAEPEAEISMVEIWNLRPFGEIGQRKVDPTVFGGSRSARCRRD